MSLNDIRLHYLVLLLIFFFLIDNFFFFFIVLNLLEAYRIDREADMYHLWEELDAGIIKKAKNEINNQVNVNVDSEENFYFEQDIDSSLEEDSTNSDDYLWWNCSFRFEHYQGYTLVSGEDHLIQKEKFSGIYKYISDIKERKKYEDDFLLYHASDFLKKKYHRKIFYEDISIKNLDLAKNTANVNFFSKFKFLRFNQNFNYKKNKWVKA
jgi:hypothetical protein